MEQHIKSTANRIAVCARVHNETGQGSGSGAGAKGACFCYEVAGFVAALEMLLLSGSLRPSRLDSTLPERERDKHGRALDKFTLAAEGTFTLDKFTLAAEGTFTLDKFTLAAEGKRVSSLVFFCARATYILVQDCFMKNVGDLE